MTLAEPPAVPIGRESGTTECSYWRTLIAREATRTMVMSAEPDWSIINAFARREIGIASVGPNVVELEKLK